MSAADSSDGLRNLKQVCEMTGCSRTRIYALMKTGDFPLPIKAWGRSLWSAQEVAAWCKAMLEQCPRMGRSMGKAA